MEHNEQDQNQAAAPGAEPQKAPRPEIVNYQKPTNREFVHFPIYDSEDRIAAFQSVNRAYIIHSFYSVSHGVYIMMVNNPTSTVRRFDIPMPQTEKQKAKNMPPMTKEAFGTTTENERMQFNDPATIVSLVNQIEGTDYTVDNYPGFAEHRDSLREMAEIMEKKRAREDYERRKKEAHDRGEVFLEEFKEELKHTAAERAASGNIEIPTFDGESKTQGGIILPFSHK